MSQGKGEQGFPYDIGEQGPFPGAERQIPIGENLKVNSLLLSLASENVRF